MNEKTLSNIRTELENAAQSVIAGKRDREKMRQACKHMDRIREENRRKFGEDDIGVQIIREMRDTE